MVHSLSDFGLCYALSNKKSDPRIVVPFSFIYIVICLLHYKQYGHFITFYLNLNQSKSAYPSLSEIFGLILNIPTFAPIQVPAVALNSFPID